ncbi:MAG TPA: AAA family ATPase [Candidatus Binatia bacterium]|nr:AAA family ATPase [Candidatus Binatia bacterium]
MQQDRTATSAASLRFANCVLDVPTRELRVGGAAVSLQPKAYDVLVYLARNRDRVVSKNELFDQLWPDEVVSESALSFSIKAIRKAVGDDGTSQQVIRTMHGRGYRFVAECLGDPAAAAAPATPALRQSGNPTRAGSAWNRVQLQPAAARFVGRAAELDTLRGELETSRQSQTRTVFVLGDPGVGKTRLSAELAAEAEASGSTVLVGRCYEGSPPAFWPWVQVVRSYVEQRGVAAARAAAGQGCADIARLVPALLDREDPDAVPALSETEVEHVRLRLFDSIVTFLRAIARERSTVVVLDDLHWADASSLLLLSHLVRELLDSPLLVLGTYRHIEVEPGGALSSLLAWLHRTRRSVRVRLHGLSQDEVGALVRELAGSEPDAELLSSFGRVTDGNPFFVEEFWRELAETREVARPAGPDGLRVPSEVHDVLLARVQRLGDGAHGVLTVASVLGREFEYGVLERCCDLPAQELLGVLEKAERAGIVHAKPDAPGSYVFAHALVNEVLYRDIGGLRRAGLHQRAGRALEQRSGGDELHRISELAHHFHEAAVLGDIAKAIQYETEAANLCMRQLAYEDATAHFERACQIAHSGSYDASKRFELLLGLARAAVRAGDDERSRAAIFDAVDIARSNGSARDLARAALRLATMYPATGGEVVALLEEAVSGLRRANADPALLARLLSALAAALYSSPGMADRRDDLADEALALARASGDRFVLLRVLAGSQVAQWRPSYLARRLELGREHVAVAEQGEDVIARVSARTWYIPALVQKGEIAEADRQIDLIEREAAASRLPAYRANALSFRSMRALLDCAWEDVEFLAKSAYEMSHRANPTSASMTLWSQLYYTRREQGRLAEIEAGIHMFSAQVTQISWDWLLCHLWCEDDRHDEAAAMLDKLMNAGFQEGLPPESHIVHFAALHGVAEVAAHTGNAEAARLLRPRLEPYAGQWVVVGLAGVCLGAVEHLLGMLAATAGDVDEGIALLEQAERIHRQAGVRLPLIRTRTELGSVLVRRGRSAQSRRGAAMLQQTWKEARDAGLVKVARQIESVAG